ncbi:MAG: hypothetical protein CMJ01_04675 [Pelagibacteraceae bacterium]|nr:hypothetical protein [Pelagibacteraceae bacterium]OUX38512.1 MAG: hypothetical protein CBE33_00565 [Candidatus Pelagibacter sp. TMED273]|tara:strand:- start:28963 stop:30435 length:1473 start_codon:yes stop_codon:yes gene_type:complete
MINSLKNKINWNFENTYLNLPKQMYSKLKPDNSKSPELVFFNNELSKKLGLDLSKLKKEELAQIFSGNKLPNGAQTIAQAYAGHQFGHFTILGDGRALMIGEVIAQNKKRYDLQFKGSGKTPYSRNADGRAALGPMLREYLISESMHGLNISTTRSLALVKTGENVIREKKLQGAVLTRVASSHIRVGTFQYALITGEKDNLEKLFSYTIQRHYPNIKNLKSPAKELLNKVLDKQIDLIIDWMRVGFIHGVMNTDNMTISGETIDYGPCAFMDTYDPKTVFSSIDLYGRYAYHNQPAIAKWNLERFAESLIPLINKNKDLALEIASEVINTFSEKYKKKWIQMMKKKLGILGTSPNDLDIILELLTWMHKNKVDYTNTFCHLMGKLSQSDEIYKDKSFNNWKKKWNQRLEMSNNSFENSLKLMQESNPLIIPRNFKVEEALSDLTDNNDQTKIEEMVKIFSNPYKMTSQTALYQTVPKSMNKNYKTYCGT